MKKIIKSFSVAIVLVAFSASVFGQGVQAPTPATVTATIITPLSLTKTVDMAFGNIAVGTTGGTIILSTAGVRTATGDASFQAGGSSAAGFTVSGVASATYAITFPASVTLTSGLNSMLVGTFTTKYSPGLTGTIGAGGTDALAVGATLTVGASQAPGAYTGSFNFTIAYN